MADSRHAAAAKRPRGTAADRQYRLHGGVFAATGFAHLLPRLALARSESTAPQLRPGNRGVDNERPLPPAIISYDFTMYNLSLPNNRPTC